jgi:hypothetical protein
VESSVALVGFYGHGNFGDDLMAVIFASSLKRLGIPFSVYRLDETDAHKYSLQSASTIEELLEGKNTIVWGGGGLLVSWPPISYNSFFPGVSADFLKVIVAARKRKMKFLAFSVGGSGPHTRQLQPEFKQAFLESVAYMTVRNQQDLEILNRFGVRGEYFPDVVWQTPEFFSVKRRRNSRLTIGIDIYWRGLLRSRALGVIPALRRFIRRREDCDFVLMDTTRCRHSGYPGPGTLLIGRNARRRQFRDLEEDIGFLASLDAIISSRMHAGLIGMACGVPFISLCAESKTRMLMSNLGLSHACFGHRDVSRFSRLLSDETEWNRFLACYSVPVIDCVKRESRGHLRHLSKILTGAPGIYSLSKAEKATANGRPPAQR